MVDSLCFGNESKNISLEFWNSVSAIYGEHNLTNHNSNYEMSFVNQMAQFIKSKNLICFGVADGSRDPITILSYLSANNMTLPSTIILNDLSPNLLNVCKTNMHKKYPTIETQYLLMPMADVTSEINTKFPNTIALIGLYSADYIMPSLKGYYESKKIIGNSFEVGATVLCDNGEIHYLNKKIKFDINDYESIFPKLSEFRTTPNFLAFSIKTDKNFISHYWDTDGLLQLMSTVFSKKKVSIEKLGDRYVMTTINGKVNSIDSDTTLITCLNNVIGNIPVEYQVSSLEMINSLF